MYSHTSRADGETSFRRIISLLTSNLLSVFSVGLVPQLHTVGNTLWRGLVSMETPSQGQGHCLFVSFPFFPFSTYIPMYTSERKRQQEGLFLCLQVKEV